MNNAHNTSPAATHPAIGDLYLTITLARITTTFNGLSIVAVAQRRHIEKFDAVEIYVGAMDNTPEMFLGYARDLGNLGHAVEAELFAALYTNGLNPEIAR